MSTISSISKRLAPRMADISPGLTASFVREALRLAIDGVGRFPPAAAAAEEQLREQHGDVDRGIHEVIENHIRYAGAQGFVTNMGGLVTVAVAIPAAAVMSSKRPDSLRKSRLAPARAPTKRSSRPSAS